MVFGNTSLIWSSFLSIYHLRALAEQSEEFEDNSKFPVSESSTSPVIFLRQAMLRMLSCVTTAITTLCCTSCAARVPAEDDGTEADR
ncbi:putative basic proline-rich protein-like isoform X2 [Iris pallida]|uniref:Basic proline-rich protein-like isoform X2 n=1 Tax=Iris pallida TaxID=29817 RepID=A0AAX6IHF0_IRIPA|nr:putative basic proline-rich protein-like isoform X2 [Iris pallida]